MARSASTTRSQKRCASCSSRSTVSLRPDFVKVDLSLVRDVNHDLTRQALIVGLRHFARATNGWLIAEGVETAPDPSPEPRTPTDASTWAPAVM
jgi:hypothetical protein